MYPVYSPHPQTCHPYPNQHVYKSWESPFSGSSGHFRPREWNGCWNYAYPPTPFISHPQPPHYYFHGAQPQCPNIYPSYFAPPSQYLADQGRSHCCGCRNHSCQRDDGGLKIEEAKPETTDNSSSGMTGWPAYPYPLVLFPPDQMKDNDQKTFKMKDNGSSAPVQWPTYPYPLFWMSPDQVKNDMHKMFEPQPNGLLDRQIPLDANSLKSFGENRDEKVQDQQNVAERMQFPLPIIWMPNYDQSQATEKKMSDATASPRVAEDLPAKLKVIPLNLLENDNCHEKHGAEDINPSSQICSTLSDKGCRSKNVPVKHVEESGQKKFDFLEKQGDYGVENYSVLEKQKGESQDEKIFDNGTKKQTSPSPGRSFKLPPVCLRVDPLPRKKRSPSPPENKEVKDNCESKVSKVGGTCGEKEHKNEASVDKVVRVVEVKDNANSQKQSAKNVKRVEVEDGSTDKKEENGKNPNELDVDSTKNRKIEVVAEKDKVEDMVKGIENKKHENLKSSGEVSLGHSENKFDDCKNAVEASDEKKIGETTGGRGKMSEIDAVLCIQSAYRRYEVRKWEPLKKLKQISRIRDQVSSIKQQIHNLEVSSEEEKLDERQKLLVGETIMNLLLQLDTIQGLHPSVREIRKSVASDLVSLQEKLDILSNKAAKDRLIEDGGASLIQDSKNDLEDVHCDSTSDMTESSSQPSPAIILDPSTADKGQGVRFEQGRKKELLVGDGIDQNSTPNNHELLSEKRDEKTGERLTREECGCGSMVARKAPVLQEEMQGDETVQASRKEDSPAEADIFMQGGNKVAVETEDLHDMQAKQIKQPAVSVPPSSATGPVMLQVEENVCQEEELVPKTLMNTEGHESKASMEGSKSPLECEDKESVMQNEKHVIQQDEFLNEDLGSYCAEADAAASSELECVESSIPEVDIKDNGSKSVTDEKHEFEISEFESINSDVPDRVGDAEHTKVYGDASVLLPSSAEADLAKDDNDGNSAAFLVEENVSEEEGSLDLPDTKDISIITTESMDGNKCENLESKVCKTEESSVEHKNKLIKENEEVWGMLEKLLEAGNKQLAMISSLSGRVKNLEKKVARRRKLRVKQFQNFRNSANSNLASRIAVESTV